ncbi:MAG: hypothetical protein ACK4WK_09080 [Anaerolineae bacterium]
MGNPVRVVIVGGEQCRQAARGWLDGAGDILIVGEAPDGRDVLRRLREVHADVVLVDVSAAPAAWVREAAAHAGIIVLHVAGQEALVLEARGPAPWGIWIGKLPVRRRPSPPSAPSAGARRCSARTWPGGSWTR